jgi:hypothetical protein
LTENLDYSYIHEAQLILEQERKINW